MNYDINRIDMAVDNLKEAVEIGLRNMSLTRVEESEINLIIAIIEYIADSTRRIMRK